MVKVCPELFPDNPRGAGFFIEATLKINLDLLYKKVTEEDDDGIIFVDGHERVGKSILAQQIGCYLAQGHETKTRWDVEYNCVFTAKDFKERVINAEKNEVIWWDEARAGVNIRRTMSDINNEITDMLAEIGQKNLFIIVVAPTFMDIDKNISCWRTKCLLHAHRLNGARGHFKFFSGKAKRYLYFEGKKRYYDYSCCNPSFRGQFRNFYTVDEKKYRAMKLTNLRAYEKEEKEQERAEKEEFKVSVTCPRCKGKNVNSYPKRQEFGCKGCGNVWPYTKKYDKRGRSDDTLY